MSNLSNDRTKSINEWIRNSRMRDKRRYIINTIKYTSTFASYTRGDWGAERVTRLIDFHQSKEFFFIIFTTSAHHHHLKKRKKNHQSKKNKNNWGVRTRVVVVVNYHLFSIFFLSFKKTNKMSPFELPIIILFSSAGKMVEE